MDTYLVSRANVVHKISILRITSRLGIAKSNLDEIIRMHKAGVSVIL